MTLRSLISPSALSICRAEYVTRTGSPVSCYNDNRVDVPPNDIYRIQCSPPFTRAGLIHIELAQNSLGEWCMEDVGLEGQVKTTERLSWLEVAALSLSLSLSEQDALIWLIKTKWKWVRVRSICHNTSVLHKLLCGICIELPKSHIFYHAHHDKNLTIQVKRLPSDKYLTRENEGKLWMWNFCGQCKPFNGILKSTKRVLVPVAAHGVPFENILEQAFLSLCLWKIPLSCGHLYYGDYFRFFGLGSMVVMFRYSRVPIYSVSLPRMKVEICDSLEGDFLKEEAEDVFQEAHSMFDEVEKTLKDMENELVGAMLELKGSCKRFFEVKEMLKQGQNQFLVNMKKLTPGMSDVSVNKQLYKPLYLNYIQWKLSLLAYILDQRISWLHSSDLSTETSDGSGKNHSSFQDKNITECGGRNVYDSVLSLKSADPKGWMWRPFPEIESLYLKDLQRGYLPRYEASSYSTKSILHKRITEEGSRLHFPLGTDNNHIVSDYEDELSSIIACMLALALGSLEKQNNSTDVKSYQSLQKISSFSFLNWCCFSFFMDSGGSSCCNNSEELVSSIFDGLEWPDSSSYLHPVFSMGRLDRTPKYSVACLFQKEFLDLRIRCGLSELDFISSLSRCKPWDAKGGKSKSFFAKTLDERFIIKEISKTELCSFRDFALFYFAYMNCCFQNGHHTCLAKILGVYQVTKEKSGDKYDVIVMENINYCRKVTRQYDLKGALYNRFIPAADGVGCVFLDQNFVYDMNTSPLYVDSKTEWDLQQAIHNDTYFLHFINVMDYSLLVGVDAENEQLVCGIIDYLRQYTWDKRLENWVKKSFMVPKNQVPTIISPQDYKKRFTKIIKNFVNAPDKWTLGDAQGMGTFDNSPIPNYHLRLTEYFKDALAEKAFQFVDQKQITTMPLAITPGGGEPSDIGEEKRRDKMVDVKKFIDSEEKIVCDWLFSCQGGKSDEVFRTKSGQVTLRVLMESFMPGCEIFGNLIDSWTELLNHEEQLSNKNSPCRLFCKTSITNGYLEDENISDAKRFGLFVENFFDSVGDDNNKRTLKGINLVFFPVVQKGHIYVLVFNLTKPAFQIIDNTGDKYEIEKKYGTLPKKLYLMLIKYMKSINHPKAEAMCAPHVKPHRVLMPWRTLNNHVDCGIFTMRHMETYKGGPLRHWRCGLDKESQQQQTQLEKLRFKYAAELLLCDINMRRDKIVKEANEYRLVDDAIRKDIRERALVNIHERLKSV